MGPLGVPGAGVVTVRAIRPFFDVQGNLITGITAKGTIVGGQFYGPGGTPFVIPATPPNETLEIWVKLDSWDGEQTKLETFQQRTVKVADQATVTWADGGGLIDTVPVREYASGDYIVPSVLYELIEARDTILVSTVAAAGSAQAAADSVAEIGTLATDISASADNANESASRAEASAVAAEAPTETALANILGNPDSAPSKQLTATFVAAVMPERYGTVGSGDDTAAIQAALTAAAPFGLTVLLPQNRDYVATKLVLPTGGKLRIDGTLTHKASTAGALVTAAAGASRIRVTINGTVDGNKSKQTTYSDGVGLIDFGTTTDLVIDGDGVVTDNYFPVATSSTFTAAAVYVRNSSDVHVRGITVTDHAREGVWLKNCTDSSQEDITTYGGVDSWSGIQASGSRITQSNLKSYNAGASGIGLDALNSSQTNCRVFDNRFFHGFNYGHTGTPADNVVSVGCEYFLSDPSINLTSGSANGFNVAGGSVAVHFIGAKSLGAKTHAFSASDGGERMWLTGCKGSGSGGAGLNVFGATVIGVDNDLSGNVSGSVVTGGTSPSYRLLNTRTGTSTWQHTLSNGNNEVAGNIVARNDVQVIPANGTDYRELFVQRSVGGIVYKSMMAVGSSGAFFAGTKGGVTFGTITIHDTRQAFVSSLPVAVPALVTGSRPAAATVGSGASVFDTTLGKPIWSNGSAWVDASGAVV